MHLDIETLLVINAANVMVMASILPLVMGRELSQAASSARASLIVQALGWVAMILSSLWVGQWPDRLLSTVSIACTSAGQLLMLQALEGWLGPRRGRTLLRVLVVLTPLGYALTFSSYPVRVGWSNLALALQLLVVCQATLRPTSRLGGNWRWVMFGCTLTMAGFTAARGVLGAFFTELYPAFKAPHPVNVLAMLAANVTLVLGNVAVLVAWREEAEEQLREQTFTDNLTNILNRRGWDERAFAIMDQARRHNTPLALIILDLDHFKQINDSFGHEVGDQVLRLIGRVLGENRRSSDLVARIGGEEFALLLPQTSQEAALHFEQRLRLAFRAATASQPMKVDYSAGLAMLSPQDVLFSHLMARADRGLYRAKEEGRGCLRISQA